MIHRSLNFFKHLGFFAVATVALGSHASEVDSQARKVKVMAYNVENLFDTVHDKNKDDWAYLPLSQKKSDPAVKAACAKISNPFYKRECMELDWSPKTLQTKITNIASMITSSFEGQGPDIIIFSEVENFAALQELQRSGLRNKGYKEIVLIEGPDSRGIDNAILSKIPLVATQSHFVELPERDGKPAHPTRDILEATFQVGSKKLTVFANHWPSQGNPTENRLAAAKTLAKAALAADARGEAVLAMGDFNCLKPELDGPIGDVLNKNFVDGVEERLANDNVKTQVPGTHWYKGHWSFLDRVYVLKNSFSERGMKLDWMTLDVHAPDFALRVNEYRRRDGTIEKTYVPYRFDTKQTAGYSDHLPLTLTVGF